VLRARPVPPLAETRTRGKPRRNLHFSNAGMRPRISLETRGAHPCTSLGLLRTKRGTTDGEFASGAQGDAEGPEQAPPQGRGRVDGLDDPATGSLPPRASGIDATRMVGRTSSAAGDEARGFPSSRSAGRIDRAHASPNGRSTAGSNGTSGTVELASRRARVNSSDRATLRNGEPDLLSRHAKRCSEPARGQRPRRGPARPSSGAPRTSPASS